LNFGTHRARTADGTRLFKRGDVIDSDVDLTECFQIRDIERGQSKFTAVDDEVTPHKPNFQRGQE
jgi:hypothetical protein